MTLTAAMGSTAVVVSVAAVESGISESRLMTSALAGGLPRIAGPDSWRVVGGARAPPEFEELRTDFSRAAGILTIELCSG